jgi:uncharacterized protein
LSVVTGFVLKSIIGKGINALRAFALLSFSLAILANPFAASKPQAAELDGWCSTVNKPSSIVICADPELRRLAINRTRLFGDAKQSLAPDAYQFLLDDQWRWIKSYSSACGVSSDGQAPTLPIPQTIIECYKRAAHERAGFLAAYMKGRGPGYQTAVIPQPSLPRSAVLEATATPVNSRAATSGAATSAMPASLNGNKAGPSFDCATAVRPLGKLICATPDLAEADLRFKQAYQALLQQLGEAGQRELAQEAADFDADMRLTCGVPEKEPVAGSPECVKAQYNEMRLDWLSRLTGSALEEANRPLVAHIFLQRALLELGYFPASVKVDGVYGTETRKAVSAWQRANGLPETGLLGDNEARSLQQQLADAKARQEKQEAKDRENQAREATAKAEREQQLLREEHEKQAREEADRQEQERHRQIEQARGRAISDLEAKIPTTDGQAILLVALGRDGGAVRRSLNGELSLMEPSRRAAACVLTDPAAPKPFVEAAVRHLMRDMAAASSTSITACTGPTLASADLVLLYNIRHSTAPSEAISQIGGLLGTHRLELSGSFALAEWQGEVENQHRLDEEFARQQTELSASIKKELLDGTFQDWGAVGLSNRVSNKACVTALQSDAWPGILKSNLPVAFRNGVQAVSTSRDSDAQLTRLLSGECLLVFAQGKDLGEIVRGLIANNRPDASILPMRVEQMVVENALAKAAENQVAPRETAQANVDKVSTPDKLYHNPAPQPLVVRPDRAMTLPSCQSTDARAALKEAMQENPLKNILTLKLFDIYNVKEISVDAVSGARQCSATAMLNAGETPILYRLFTKDGNDRKFYVELKVDDQR